MSRTPRSLFTCPRPKAKQKPKVPRIAYVAAILDVVCMVAAVFLPQQSIVIGLGLLLLVGIPSTISLMKIFYRNKPTTIIFIAAVLLFAVTLISVASITSLRIAPHINQPSPPSPAIVFTTATESIATDAEAELISQDHRVCVYSNLGNGRLIIPDSKTARSICNPHPPAHLEIEVYWFGYERTINCESISFIVENIPDRISKRFLVETTYTQDGATSKVRSVKLYRSADIEFPEFSLSPEYALATLSRAQFNQAVEDGILPKDFVDNTPENADYICKATFNLDFD